MAKRKLGIGSSENILKSAKEFHIPALLKTEQIEVEVKPEIDTPCTDSKISITSNYILFTCSGCGTSGTHNLGLEYRLVKTALLVEFGTQTGDEFSASKIQLEDSGKIVDNGLLDRDRATYREIIPATSTSSTTPVIVSSDNDDNTSDDDECSDEDDCLGESGGEEEISSSEDDMMLGLTDLSDSSEDDETHCLQQSTSPNLSRAKSNLIQKPSSSVSPSHSSDNKEQTSKATNEANEQSSYFQCKIRGCPVEKPSEKDLFEHVIIDHPDRKYQCDVCPTAFKMKTDLDRHSRKHSEDKPFLCDECGNSFKWDKSLQNHKLTHNEQRMISCGMGKCGLRMPRENLEHHIKTTHPKYKHKCLRCPMSFKCNYDLAVHKRVHTGDKPYKCKECGKGFKQLSNLKRHMRTNTGEKPFLCTTCGNRFSRSNTLRLHEISCSMKL
eukprot:sb/3464777/